MKISFLTIVTGLASLVALQPMPGVAQGTAFAYQGVLSDGVSPANGLYDLTFTVYDAASGGAAIGDTITNAPTGVTNGLFVTALDFGALPFDGGSRWLEIGVRTNGSAAPFSILAPRQPILSVPYAIRAREAETVPDGAITGSKLSLQAVYGDTQIYPYSVTSNNLAPGSVTTDKIADGAVTGSKIGLQAVYGDTQIYPLSITSNNLASSSVNTEKIQDGSVTGSKIGLQAVYGDTQIYPLSITSNNLASSSVNTEKIHDGSVTGSKIGLQAVYGDTQIYPLSVTSNNLASSSVNTDKIHDGSVTGSKIGLQAVYGDTQIYPLSITSNNLAAASVTTDKLVDGVVTWSKLDPAVSDQLGGLTASIAVIVPGGETNILCFTNGLLREVR